MIIIQIDSIGDCAHNTGSINSYHRKFSNVVLLVNQKAIVEPMAIWSPDEVPFGCWRPEKIIVVDVDELFWQTRYEMQVIVYGIAAEGWKECFVLLNPSKLVFTVNYSCI